jgi:membrane protein YqaA with SNARE-associated domain
LPNPVWLKQSGLTSELTPSRRLFDIWAVFCNSERGLVLMFLWALSEAVFWPIVPDALLMPMVAGGPKRYWRLLGACILGSTLGGMAIYLFAYFNPHGAELLAPRLPLAQPFMIEKAATAMAEQGIGAFWTQPWSGISYRFYALLAGVYGSNPALVVLVSTCARALRMTVCSAPIAFTVGRFPSFFRDWWVYILLIFFAAFGYVWVTTQVIG